MPESILAFALASLVIEITPGPNMAYLAVLSAERGRIAGFAAVAGVALGLLLLGLIAGLGVGTLIAETRWLYEVLRWSGVILLLYFAWDSFRETRRPVGARDTGGRLTSYFGRGFITNLLNPKAALFYVTVMPNFIDAVKPQWQQAAVLTLVYVAVATAIHATIAQAGSLLQPWLKSDRVRRPAGIVAALLLIGIAVWLAVSTRRIG